MSREEKPSKLAGRLYVAAAVALTLYYRTTEIYQYSADEPVTDYEFKQQKYGTFQDD